MPEKWRDLRSSKAGDPGKRIQDSGIQEVAEVVIETLRPIRKQYKTLMEDTERLGEILRRGAERARAVAEPKVQEVKRRVGFIV